MPNRKSPDFVHAAEVGNSWLNELMKGLTVNRHGAWSVLCAVLHTLRDRLTPEQIAHLGNQLPLVIRGTLYDQWRPGHKEKTIRKEADFLDHVQRLLPDTLKIDVKDAVKEVFAVLAQHPTGEILKIIRTLPPEIGALASQEPSPRQPDSAFAWE